MTMTDAERVATEVVLGVDTHLDVHVVVALDGLGRRLGESSVPTTASTVSVLSSSMRRRILSSSSSASASCRRASS